MVTFPAALAPDSLVAELQHLHASLPTLGFEPGKDSRADELDSAAAYRQHYQLDALSDRGAIHYLGQFEAAGFTIACQYWLPAQARGSVFVVHGYFDHSALYRHLFDYLLAQGYAVCTFDLPGHGLSDGERVSIASFDRYVEVLDAILARAADKLPAPWHGVGQSTGGAIILKHLLEERDAPPTFSQVTLLAPLLHPRHWWWNRLVYLAAHRFINKIGRSFNNSSGDKTFKDFLARQDPLQARHIPLEWVGSMKRWTEEFETLPTSQRDLVIIQGDQDHTLAWRYNLRQFRRRLPNARLEIIPGARHQLVNETETLRQQVFAAMELTPP